MTNAPVIAHIVSPNATDTTLAVRILADNGIDARAFASLQDVAADLDEDSGCLVAVEDALIADQIPVLREALNRLPAWSDIPLIVIARNVAALGVLTARAFPDSGHVTLLEYPLSPHTLLSAVQVALRATAHQRELANLISQRENDVRLRDEFLAMLAHELRNPLAPMRNALYLTRMAKVDSPVVQKSTDILERQVNHLVRMVDDLMDVARLERGKVSLQKERIDLNRTVACALESCTPAVEQRGHRVAARFSVEPLPVDADAVRIEQIVCNLVNNAAKFSPQPGEVCVETRAEDGFAVVAVQDQGIGFEPTAASRLFDPFVQASQTLERASGGLGMGLTIVKRLAELHGGTASASSDGPGKGACFSVRLPLASGTTAARSKRRPRPGVERKRRIVVVEDNPDILETTRVLLNLWGHDVETANDGPSGVDRILHGQPDIALIDVGLPLMNGYEVARAIRRTIPAGRMTLIAVTGYGQPLDQDLARQAGFDLHLLKPIAPEVLERILAE